MYSRTDSSTPHPPENQAGIRVPDIAPSTVFDFVCDLDQLPHWNAAITRVVSRPLVLEPGAAWTVEMRDGSRRWISRSTLVEPASLAEPARHVAASQQLDRLTTAGHTTLLGVWAHPDDEAYLSAALMHRVTTAGGRVVVATATLGEAGLESLSPERAAAVRHQELRAALASVDVTDLRILGYPDGGCQDVEHGDGVARVEAVIRDVRPDVIVTFAPDGITGHPDHVAVSRWTIEAWKRAGHGELLLATMTDGFLVEHEALHHRVGLSMGPALRSVPEREVVLRVTPSLVERSRKRHALDAHRSQTGPLTELLGYSAFHDWCVDECFRSPTPADLQWAAPAETAGRAT